MVRRCSSAEVRARRASYDIAALLPRLDTTLSGNAARRAEAFWERDGACTANDRSDPVQHRLGSRAGVWRSRCVQGVSSMHGATAIGASCGWSRRTKGWAGPDVAGRRPGDRPAPISPMCASSTCPAGSGRTCWSGIVASSCSRWRSVTTTCGAGSSTYRLSLPVRPAVRVDRVVVDIGTDFFDRTFTLEGRLESGEQVQLAHGRLRRFQTKPVPVEITFRPQRGQRARADDRRRQRRPPRDRTVRGASPTAAAVPAMHRR